LQADNKMATKIIGKMLPHVATRRSFTISIGIR
jgi:hypothetical protein